MAKKKAYSKEKKVEYMVDYKNHNKLAILSKKWSPTVEFLMEKGEDWFVDVVIYKKSGEITKSSMITKNQVEDWIERYTRIKGYTKS